MEIAHIQTFDAIESRQIYATKKAQTQEEGKKLSRTSIQRNFAGYVCPRGSLVNSNPRNTISVLYVFVIQFQNGTKFEENLSRGIQTSQKHKYLIASRQELLEKTTIATTIMASNELHDPWCKAMLDCTACLREQRAEGADQCLAYLWILEQQLEKEGILVGGDSDDDEDDKIPINYPLRWTEFCAKVQEFQDVEVAMAKGLAKAPTRIRYKNSIRLSGQSLLTRILTFQSTRKEFQWQESSAIESIYYSISKSIFYYEICILIAK